MVSDYNTPTVLSGGVRRITGALTAGTLIGARYNVLRLLGRGGFGAVYLATDNRFPARRVAVKEMGDARLNAKDRMQAIARFRQEANLLSSLQHPNLPAVSDFLEEGGKAYLVMDFIDGQTLEEVQKARGGPLDEAQVMDWALQICNVLAYLHTQPQPIIFRDLKPPNTMVTPAGQIKLIDFGIARIFRANAERDTNWLGSQGYAAPEQYGLEQTDARTDIYALGAMLYTLLTAREPPASFTRIVSPGSLLTPSQFNPRISPAVERVIATAMEVEKRQRYQSVGEMAQAIGRLGFSTSRPSGEMRPPTGPNAPVITSTQPGSPMPSPTLYSSATQINTLNAFTAPQASAPTYPVPGQSNTSSTLISQVGSSPLSSAPSTGATVPGGPGMYGGASGQTLPGTRPFPAPPGPTGPQSAGSPGQGPRGGISRRALLLGAGGATALVAATGIYFFFKNNSGLSSSSASGTVTVNLAYSTEKKDWLAPAVNAFNASNQKLRGSNKVIQVQLGDLGSVDSVGQILQGQLKPVAWSPASILEVNRLNYQWQKIHPGVPLISYTEQFQPRSLVKSPLVLASWQQRAQLLLQHYAVSTLDWGTLHSAFAPTNDWSQVGGQSSWGKIKFGQTLPVQSNSGLLTITLLAYASYGEPRSLTSPQVNAARCWDYLRVFEDAVNAFGHSSGTYLTNDVISAGPPQADVIATYESLVLKFQSKAQQSQYRQPLLIYYPSVNLLSDHPFVVLQGAWVQDEQKQAALQLRDFLLASDQQLQALTNGFRPADTSIALQDTKIAHNPFTDQAAFFPAHQPDQLLSQAQAPSGDTVDALLSSWQKYYPTPPTTDG
ncbi:MAG TPA: protein kinase [Ktedonobacteraceae bacterium]